MEFKTIIYEVKDKVGHVTLNRPERHNALSSQLLDDIDAVFQHAENRQKRKCNSVERCR